MKKKNFSPKTLKLRRRFYFFFLLVIALTMGIALSFAVLFKIESISVHGDSRYSSDEIIESSGAKKGLNLFLFDTKKSSNNVKSSLPYLEEAKVTKRFPCSLKIEVRDAKPMGAIEVPDGFVYINYSGKILEKKSGESRDFCLLKGISLDTYQPGSNIIFEDTHVEEMLYQLIDLIKKYSLEVSMIDVSDQSNLVIEYQDRINVILGFPERLDYKIKTVSQILQNKIRKEEKGTLDISLVIENDRSYFTPEQ